MGIIMAEGTPPGMTDCERSREGDRISCSRKGPAKLTSLCGHGAASMQERRVPRNALRLFVVHRTAMHEDAGAPMASVPEISLTNGMLAYHAAEFRS